MDCFSRISVYIAGIVNTKVMNTIHTVKIKGIDISKSFKKYVLPS